VHQVPPFFEEHQHLDRRGSSLLLAVATGIWAQARAPASRGGCRVKGSVRPGHLNSGMGQNFIESGREQGFLLPPDVRDWLAAVHLAWFVIDAVAQMDLSGFYAAYRADGHGRAAYEPSMMA
jgi:hypothetical protein